jgi:hypothetical protein
MSQASTPLITALKQLLREAGVSDDDISQVEPVPPEAGIATDDQRQATALARRLATARSGEAKGACRFKENNLDCTLNTTANDCKVIGAMHGGSTFSPNPAPKEQWVAAASG